MKLYEDQGRKSPTTNANIEELIDSAAGRRVKMEDRLWAVNARITKVQEGGIDTRDADDYNSDIDEKEE